MKQIVYVLLRGGIYPSTYVGTFATIETAQGTMAAWQRTWPDLRFTIIEAEVQP